MQIWPTNNWGKGIVFAFMFFVALGIITNFFPGDSSEAGGRAVEILLPLIFIGIGFYYGRKYFKKRFQKIKKCLLICHN